MSAQEQVYMSLKVLYTLDNDPNSFLSRSTEVVPVLLEQVPNPNNESTMLRIGAIDAEKVLQQVCQSSPELFPSFDGGQLLDKSRQPLDFNVYVKDICEEDEPFVSLGLLSKLRQESHLDRNYMVGRVCTNFASLLQRSRSQVNSFAGAVSKDTLEIKVRFSKVMTRANSRRSSIGASNASAPVKAKRMPSGTNIVKRPSISGPSGGIVKKKRDTNPMPAPKAVRTQSLPIWNNPGIPRNSIAHKIYMADRNKEQNQQPLDSRVDKKLTYQVSSLQQDNSVSKFKVDDSISKRFDFMKKRSSNGGKKSTVKSKQSEKKQKRLDHNILANSIIEENLDIDMETPDIFNKENIPPTDTNIEDLLLELGTSNEDWFQGLFQSPVKKTPNDINTCNTNPIDVDRTSPIDTLSMPLVDLEPNSDGPMQITTGEQLKRLSLLPNIKKRKARDSNERSNSDNLDVAVNLEDGDEYDDEIVVEDEDSTSIMLQFSTSPSIVQESSGAKLTTMVGIQNEQQQQAEQQLRQKPCQSQPDSDDDYESKKRSTAMPSSPTAIFQYQLDETSTESEHEYSNGRKQDQNSTPATQYGFSDDKLI